MKILRYVVLLAISTYVVILAGMIAFLFAGMLARMAGACEIPVEVKPTALDVRSSIRDAVAFDEPAKIRSHPRAKRKRHAAKKHRPDVR